MTGNRQPITAVRIAWVNVRYAAITVSLAGLVKGSSTSFVKILIQHGKGFKSTI